MINKYYINIQMEETNNAGSKAVNDCNEIFRRNGIEPYTLKIKNSGNKYLIKLNKFLEKLLLNQHHIKESYMVIL